MKNPINLYLKYGKADEKEIQNFLKLCRFSKEKFDYNKIYKLRYEIESAVSFFIDIKHKKPVSLVYFLWFFDNLKNEKITILAKTIAIFGKRNKKGYNTKFYLIPNNKKKFGLDDLITPSGKTFALMRQKPDTELLSENIRNIIEHYPEYNHFAVVFLENPKSNELKIISELSKKIIVFVIVVHDSGLYLVKRNFYIKRIFTWTKRNKKLTSK